MDIFSTNERSGSTQKALQPKPGPERERFPDGELQSWASFFGATSEVNVIACALERYDADDYDPDRHETAYFYEVLARWQRENEGVADLLFDFLESRCLPEDEYRRLCSVASAVKAAFRDSSALIEWLCGAKVLTKDPFVRELMWNALRPDALDSDETPPRREI